MTSQAPEKRWIEWLGAALQRRLKTAGDTPELRSLSWLQVLDAENSDGWAAEFATLQLGRRRVALHVLVDRFSGHARRVPWVGAFVPGEETARAAYSHLKRHGLNPLLVRPGGMVTSEDDVSSLARPLPASQFGRPIIELYDGEYEQGVGLYLTAPRSYRTKPSESLVSSAVRFVREFAVSTNGAQPSERLRAPASIALRRSVVSIRAVARSSEQAAAAKARDRYSCRLCGFRPEVVYGVEGRSCLEAHHLDAIATQRRVVSNLDRLITLCANCHRIVHRLSEADRDLNRLRRRFRARGK